MSPDTLTPSVPSTPPSRLAQAFGAGELPPPRFELRARPRGGTEPIDAWAVRSFELDEQLNAPYVLRARVVIEGDVDPEALLGTRVELEIARGDASRVVHGVVLESDLFGDAPHGAGVRIQVGPALALLGFYRRSRIFQGRSVPEIVRAIVEPLLVEQGSALVLDRLVSTYEPRDYCVQWRETDLEFVLRLLSEAGITLLFDHGGVAERVVLVDTNEALAPAGLEPLADDHAAAAPVLPFVPDRADELLVESIRTLRQGAHLHRGRWSAAVWDWKAKPAALVSCKVGLDDRKTLGGSWEVEEGRPDEGKGTDQPIGDPAIARVDLEQRRDRATGTQLRATSNATIIRAGSVFEVDGAPHDGYVESWVVTRVRHRGDAPHAVVDGSAEDARPEYSSEIDAQPRDVPVVPPALPRPHVPGIQTARVTGPEGEVIHTDRFGRIRVRMLWDDAAHDGEETSCWLRVALPWAGDDFGLVFIPRVGSEVVVSFVDGDPDRPLCTGGVFNGSAMPPYNLPDDKTRTVLRTRSTDGQGYNELSFQDADGAEQIYLHAQRDLREHVRQDHSTYVAGNRRSAISCSRSTMVGKDEILSVTGDQCHTVVGDVEQHFKGACRLRVSEAPKAPDDKGFTITVARGAYEVDAADAIVLRCGESRIELQRGQIVITSPQIIARSSVAAGPHPTAITLASGGIEIAANELHERVVVARTDADQRVAIGVGPNGENASLCMATDAVKLDAKARMDVASGAISVLGRESLLLDGASTGVNGEQVAITAEGSIQITSSARVAIVGIEQISLN